MTQKKSELVVKESNPIRVRLSRLADWLNKHWVLKTIVTFIPSIWSPIIITGLGALLRLKTDSGLTAGGWIGVALVYPTALLASILSGYKAKRDAEKNVVWASKVDEYESAIGLLNTLFDAEHSFEKAIVQHTLEQSNSVKWLKEDSEKIKKLYSPKYSMQEINKQLKSCFIKITNLNKRDILVSSLISLDGKNWTWIDRDDVYSGLDIDELIQEGTTFYEVCSGRTFYAYANDKKKAAEGGGKYKYRYDNKDQQSETKGSIICWMVTIGNGDRVIARLIINISTYNKKIADGLDDPVEIDSLYNDTILNHILKHFEGEIQLALVSYYLASMANTTAVKPLDVGDCA